MLISLFTSASLLIAPALQAAPAACPAMPVSPPVELAGWSAGRTIAAAADAAGVVPVTVGQGVRATLLPVGRVTYPVAPARAGPGAHGGLLAVDVSRAGRYRVALGAAAWIDMVQGGRALSSVGHGHGPACTGIRKIVDFDLRPGRHVLEIAGAPDAVITVLIAAART